MKPLLNTPAESLQRRHGNFLVEHGLIPLMAATTAVAFALLEWGDYLFDLEPRPWPVTIVAVAMVGFAIVRLRRTQEIGRRVHLGIQGEKSVAETLDELRTADYRVFHDLECDGFNIDHVVVGRAGVFVIETKARSKPEGRRAAVAYDGERILVDGFAPDRDPLVQARAGARYVRRRLEEVTDRNIPVRPVVVFPEWWVWEGPRDAEVWVLNPTRLLGYLRHEPQRLAAEEARRIAAILSDLARLRAT